MCLTGVSLRTVRKRDMFQYHCFPSLLQGIKTSKETQKDLQSKGTRQIRYMSINLIVVNNNNKNNQEHTDAIFIGSAKQHTKGNTTECSPCWNAI